MEMCYGTCFGISPGELEGGTLTIIKGFKKGHKPWTSPSRASMRRWSPEGTWKGVEEIPNTVSRVRSVRNIALKDEWYGFIKK